MKKNTDTMHQFSFHPFLNGFLRLSRATRALILGCLATAFFVAVSNAQSRYTVDVLILEYYGAQGHDSNGRPIYGVKVEQGGHIYFVEMRDPMPCLVTHKNEVARVAIDRNTSNWGKVTFDGHFAEIYKVTKVANDRDNHSHHDSHDHEHENRNKLPFSNWREDLFGSNAKAR